MSGTTGTRRRPPAAGRASRLAHPGTHSSRTRYRPTRSERGPFAFYDSECHFVPRFAPRADLWGSYEVGARHVPHRRGAVAGRARRPAVPSHHSDDAEVIAEALVNRMDSLLATDREFRHTPWILSPKVDLKWRSNVGPRSRVESEARPPCDGPGTNSAQPVPPTTHLLAIDPIQYNHAI
jgi:hypothetical protein